LPGGGGKGEPFVGRRDRAGRPAGRRGPVVVGLVGGIGSGKSRVAELFENLGAHRIDADRLAHRALREAEVKAKIRKRWGDKVFTPRGAVSRAALARQVFEEPGALRALERILHPRVRSAIRSQLEVLKQRPRIRVVVLDVPLLAEGGLDRWCDVIVFVKATRRSRLARLKASRDWDLEELAKREKFQIPLKVKGRLADDTIDNDRSLRETRRQVESIWNRLVPSDASDARGAHLGSGPLPPPRRESRRYRSRPSAGRHRSDASTHP